MTVPIKRKRTISTSLGLTIILLPLSLIGIQVLFTAQIGCACGKPEDRGRYGILLIRPAQIEHHSRYGTFPQSLDLLQLEIPLSYTKSFQFSVQAEKDRGIVYATPIYQEVPVDQFHLGLVKLEFRSVVSATAFYQGRYVWIVCQSEQPTTAKPPEPILRNGQFTCPAKFKQLGYF